MTFNTVSALNIKILQHTCSLYFAFLKLFHCIKDVIVNQVQLADKTE